MKVHMISFKMPKTNSYSCVFGDGANILDEHLDIVEEWLAEMRAARDLDGSDLV